MSVHVSVHHRNNHYGNNQEQKVRSYCRFDRMSDTQSHDGKRFYRHDSAGSKKMTVFIIQIIFFMCCAYIIVWLNNRHRSRGIVTLASFEDRINRKTLTIRYRDNTYLVCLVSEHKTMEEAVNEAERILPDPIDTTFTLH